MWLLVRRSEARVVDDTPVVRAETSLRGDWVAETMAYLHGSIERRSVMVYARFARNRPPSAADMESARSSVQDKNCWMLASREVLEFAVKGITMWSCRGRFSPDVRHKEASGASSIANAFVPPYPNELIAALRTLALGHSTALAGIYRRQS